MTHPALESPESRACVEALWAVNPDGAAEILAAFPEGVFSWVVEASSCAEGSSQTQEPRGSNRLEGGRQGRLM
jgi:hypothetical protein